MKADLHSWEFLGIPRNSQKAGNSFRKGCSIAVCIPLEDKRQVRPDIVHKVYDFSVDQLSYAFVLL